MSVNEERFTKQETEDIKSLLDIVERHTGDEPSPLTDRVRAMLTPTKICPTCQGTRHKWSGVIGSYSQGRCETCEGRGSIPR